MRVVRRIARVDLGVPMGCEERGQRLIDEGGVIGTGTQATSILQELGVHGGAQPCPVHATSMPWGWSAAARAARGLLSGSRAGGGWPTPPSSAPGSAGAAGGPLRGRRTAVVALARPPAGLPRTR